MVDIPQEVNQQALYGLIKRLTRIQKFFSEGDVFSLKEEKKESENGEIFTPIKKTSSQPNTRSPQVYKKSQLYPIIIDKEKSKKEMRLYFTTTSQGRKDRAQELGLTFKDYGIKMNYIKRKWKFSPKEVGVSTLNLGHRK